MTDMTLEEITNMIESRALFTEKSAQIPMVIKSLKKLAGDEDTPPEIYADILRCLALIMIYKRDSKKAIFYYEELFSLTSLNPKPEDYYRSGICYFEQKEYTKAIKHFTAIEDELEQEKQTILMSLAQSYFFNQNYNEALEYLNRYKTSCDNLKSEDAHLNLVEILSHFMLKDKESANQILEQYSAQLNKSTYNLNTILNVILSFFDKAKISFRAFNDIPILQEIINNETERLSSSVDGASPQDLYLKATLMLALAITSGNDVQALDQQGKDIWKIYLNDRTTDKKLKGYEIDAFYQALKVLVDVKSRQQSILVLDFEHMSLSDCIDILELKTLSSFIRENNIKAINSPDAIFYQIPQKDIHKNFLRFFSDDFQSEKKVPWTDLEIVSYSPSRR